MTSRIRIGISLVTCSMVLVGCVGQNKQNSGVRASQSVAAETMTHRCFGSVCGDSGLLSQWTLDNDSMRPFGLKTREGLSCLGSVCGPDAMSPMWILVQPEGICLSTVCGNKLATPSFVQLSVRIARSNQTWLDKQ